MSHVHDAAEPFAGPPLQEAAVEQQVAVKAANGDAPLDALPEGATLEALRLKALRDCRVLDTPAEERFDNITKLLQGIFQVGSARQRYAAHTAPGLPPCVPLMARRPLRYEQRSEAGRRCAGPSPATPCFFGSPNASRPPRPTV